MSEFEKTLIEDLERLGKSDFSDLKAEKLKLRLFSKLGIEEALIADVKEVGEKFKLDSVKKAKMKEVVFSRIETAPVFSFAVFFKKYQPVFASSFVLALVVVGGLVFFESENGQELQISQIENQEPEVKSQKAEGIGSQKSEGRSQEVQNEEFRVQSEEFRMQSEEFRMQSEEFRVQSEEFRVQNEEFRVQNEESQKSEGRSQKLEGIGSQKAEVKSQEVESQEEEIFVAYEVGYEPENSFEQPVSNVQQNYVMSATIVKDDWFEPAEEAAEESEFVLDTEMKPQLVVEQQPLIMPVFEPAPVVMDIDVLRLESSTIQKCVNDKRIKDKKSSVYTLISVCKTELSQIKPLPLIKEEELEVIKIPTFNLPNTNFETIYVPTSFPQL